MLVVALNSTRKVRPAGLLEPQPLIEVADQRRGGIGDDRPRREDTGGARIAERFVVPFRDDAASINFQELPPVVLPDKDHY